MLRSWNAATSVGCPAKTANTMAVTGPADAWVCLCDLHHGLTVARTAMPGLCREILSGAEQEHIVAKNSVDRVSQLAQSVKELNSAADR